MTMTYKQSTNYHNYQLAQFVEVGKYEIPQIVKFQEATDNLKFLGFNYAKTEKDPEEKTLHFYLDDYQFERVWNSPTKYINLLKKFKYVLAPDFSLFTDIPVAVNIYNHYRKHWLACYWQSLGINVIPTICWSDKESFDWCFEGEPKNSVVSVSSIGANYSKASREAFLEGYKEMERRLEPTQVIFYGKVPEELKDRKNIVCVENEQIARLRKIEVPTVKVKNGK